jgi:hypothetical protein
MSITSDGEGGHNHLKTAAGANVWLSRGMVTGITVRRPATAQNQVAMEVPHAKD